MNTKLYDSHLHTSFSGDSETPPEEQIARAAEKGFAGICFTDHDDHDVVSEVDFDLDVPAYFKKMQELRDKYANSLDIRIGIESGLQTGTVGYQHELVKEYNFDYVIGSVHFVGGLDPYYPEYFRKYGKKSYLSFFECTLECVKAHDDFDALGHLDYIARYGGPYGLTYSYEQYREAVDPILEVLIRKNKALECNTGGLSRGLSFPNPSFDVIRRYRELGGRMVTLGSDAHSPETLGCEFEKTLAALKEIGFDEYVIYRNRRPEPIKIDL